MHEGEVECWNMLGEKKTVPISELEFRPSVYGIVVHENKVLLSRQWDGFDIPGGAIHVGETFEVALQRELKEETGIIAQCDKLLHVQQDFFLHPITKKTYQSQLMYFSCKDHAGEISKDGFATDEKVYMQEARWVPLADIDNLRFYAPVDCPALIQMAARGDGRGDIIPS